MLARGWRAVLVVLLSLACTRGGVAGRYVSERERSPNDYLNLAGDGTFTLQEDGGTLTGSYSVNGSRITLTPTAGVALSGTLDGGTLIDQTGTRWTKQ
jgi:hypothetical protein